MKSTKSLLKIFLVIACLTAVNACKEEPGGNEPTPDDETGTMMKFTVGGAAIDTKTSTGLPEAEQIDRISISDPGDPDQLYLIVTAQKIDDLYGLGDVATKGTPIYTENFVAERGDISTIPYDGTSVYTGGKSYWSGLLEASTRTYGYDFGEAGWPESASSLLFFFGSPEDLTSKAASAEDASGNYGCYNIKCTPGSKANIAFDFVTPGAAEKQEDILFTTKDITKQYYFERKDEHSKVLFYHTLAGVKFKSGNAPREINKDGSIKSTNTGEVVTSITDIALTNILSTGHCVVTPSYDPDYTNNDSNPYQKDDKGQVDKSALVSVWSGVATKANYKVSGLQNISNGTNSSYTYPGSTDFEGETAPGNSKELGQYNLNDADFSKTFFFVPQTTGADATIAITYTITRNGETKTNTRKVKFNGQTWKPGYLYTYTLTANHVALKISDDIDPETGKTKSNLKIQNTGNTDAYIRATVIGNWFDTHVPPQIVTEWAGFSYNNGKLGTTDGSFTGLDETHWVYSDPEKGGDGFFYYKYKVKPGNKVKFPLFTSFTASSDGPSGLYGESAHLEMDILAQSFHADKIDKMIEAYGWLTDVFVDQYDDELE